jgi:hypothetical protein
MPDPAFWILVTAMIASVILVVLHPVKLLAGIQAILTGLVVVAFIAPVWMVGWLTKASEPVRQLWEPRCEVISLVALWGTLVPWILFTIYHAVIVGWRKLHPKANE